MVLKKLIALFALIVGAGSASTFAQTPKVLKTAYVPSLSFAPAFLAAEKGYLEREGVQLEFQTVQGAADVVSLLATGQLDLALVNVGATFFNGAARGFDTKIVGGISAYPVDPETRGPAPILARKALVDSGAIKALVDLKGRSFASNAPGGIVEYSLAREMQKVGLPFPAVKIERMAFPSIVIAMANGAVDSAVLPEPLATSAISKGIGVPIVRNPVPGTLVGSVLFGKAVLADPNTGAATLRALRLAVNELQSDAQFFTASNLAIWSKYTKVPTATIAMISTYSFPRDLVLDTKSLMDQQKYLIEIGLVKTEVPLDKLVDRRFVVTR